MQTPESIWEWRHRLRRSFRRPMLDSSVDFPRPGRGKRKWTWWSLLPLPQDNATSLLVSVNNAAHGRICPYFCPMNSYPCPSARNIEWRRHFRPYVGNYSKS
jgi:hypothetical protein